MSTTKFPDTNLVGQIIGNCATAKRSIAEEAALEVIHNAYMNSEIDYVLYSKYFDAQTQWRIKEYGQDCEEDEIQEVFEWLLERDDEYVLTKPVSALRYYAEEYYDKFNR